MKNDCSVEQLGKKVNLKKMWRRVILETVLATHRLPIRHDELWLLEKHAARSIKLNTFSQESNKIQEEVSK